MRRSRRTRAQQTASTRGDEAEGTPPTNEAQEPVRTRRSTRTRTRAAQTTKADVDADKGRTNFSDSGNGRETRRSGRGRSQRTDAKQTAQTKTRNTRNTRASTRLNSSVPPSSPTNTKGPTTRGKRTRSGRRIAARAPSPLASSSEDESDKEDAEDEWKPDDRDDTSYHDDDDEELQDELVQDDLELDYEPASDDDSDEDDMLTITVAPRKRKNSVQRRKTRKSSPPKRKRRRHSSADSFDPGDAPELEDFSPTKAGVTSTSSSSSSSSSSTTTTTTTRNDAETLALVKAQLQLSAIPASMPCRENERRQILRFVESGIEQGGVGHALYISGVPGTGKTATVREVVRTLRKRQRAGKLDDFVFVELNGLKLQRSEEAYRTIFASLTGKRAQTSRAREELTRLFKSSQERKVTVVLVDELDALVTRKQTVLYNLFDWPSLPHAHLVVIGIANTMDLPERLLPKINSRMGLTRISFAPYNRMQLQQIVSERLQSTGAFDDEAIEFSARKIAAISGDCRRALNICHRATVLAQEDLEEGKLEQLRVTHKHVQRAVDEMFSSSMVRAIQHASQQEKMFLCSMLMGMRLEDTKQISFRAVCRRHLELCWTYNLNPPSSSALTGIVDRLASCRLVNLESAHAHLDQRLSLNVDDEDVHYALSSAHPMGTLLDRQQRALESS